MTSTRHTRYPVFRTSLDDLVGILNVHAFLSAMAERGLEAIRIEELVRPAYVVPETKNLGALLAELRRTRQQRSRVLVRRAIRAFPDGGALVMREDHLGG
jgi:putative hemolysin